MMTLALILISTLISIPAQPANKSVELKVGAPAPAFETKTVDGKTLRLSDFKGKVVMLDFMASWCGNCLATVPDIKNMQKEFPKSNFEIISISLDGGETTDTTIRDIRRVIDTYKIDWLVAFDNTGWDNTIVQNYHINSLPTHILIDKDGIIRLIFVGKDKAKLNELRSVIKKLL